MPLKEQGQIFSGLGLGASLMTTKRTNTAVVQTRIDLRVLAGLARYADAQGRSPRKTQGFKKANLVQSSLELLHDSLRINKLLEPFELTADALGYLEELGYGMDTSINTQKLRAAIDAETYQAIELLNKPSISEAAKTLLSESD